MKDSKLVAEGKRVAEAIEEIAKKYTDDHGEVGLITDAEDAKKVAELGDELKSITAVTGSFEGASTFLGGLKSGAPTPPLPDGEQKVNGLEGIIGARAEYKAEMFTQNLGRMYEGKADFTSTSESTGLFLAPHERLAPYAPPLRRLTVRDAFFMSGRTGAPAVDYLELTTETHNAAGQTEGSAKAEDAYEYTLRTAGVKTVATTLPVTNQLMSDYPALVSLVQGRMMQGLNGNEDRDLVWGAGGVDLTGIMNTSGVQDAASVVSIGASDTYLDIIRKMMTAAWSGTGAIVEGHYPTSVGMSPLVKQDIDLIKDNEENYIFAVIQNAGGMRVWGLDIVESNAFRDPDDLNDHYIMVGSKSAGQIWDREDTNFAIGLVNDQFKKNMQTLRVEKRLASGLYSPSSFIYYQLANIS